MDKHIKVQQAEIKTASIEVRVLSVNNRNLNLSLFRQIPVRSLLNPVSLEFDGVIWGKVNYYWGNEKGYENMPNYVHVLWATPDGELRRDILNKNEIQIFPQDISAFLRARGKRRNFLKSRYTQYTHLLEEVGKEFDGVLDGAMSIDSESEGHFSVTHHYDYEHDSHLVRHTIDMFLAKPNPLFDELEVLYAKYTAQFSIATSAVQLFITA